MLGSTTIGALALREVARVIRPTASRLAFVLVGQATVLALAALVVAPSPGRSATHTVEIADFTFSPATITIQAGDTVTWTNADPVEHTATSTSGGWDTGLIAEGASASITFTEPGTYDYLCSPHPTMTGRIVVTAAPAPSPAPAGGALPDVAVPTGGAPWPFVAGGVLVLLAVALAVRRRTRADLPS